MDCHMSDKQFEYQFKIPGKCMTGERIHKGCYYLRPGEEVEAFFNGEGQSDLFNETYKYRLRITGEVDIYPPWRQESAFPLLYRFIDDCLDSKNVHHSPHSLKLGSTGCNYSQAAYYKVIRTEGMFKGGDLSGNSPNELSFGIYYNKNNIKYLPGGRISLVAEVFYKIDERHVHDISGHADKVFSIDIGEGSCGWEEKFISISLEKEPCCILVYVIGEKFSGAVWLEDPMLVGENDINHLPPFTPANACKRDFNWLGCNLSRKEWPAFDITVNDKKIFSGELFERIYRWPTLEVDIPKGILKKKDNKLSIKYISDYREALPYKLREIEFVGIACDDFNIISSPRTVEAGIDFSILVSTGKPDMIVKIESGDKSIVPVQKEMLLKNPGLHAIRFYCFEAGADAGIFFETENVTYSTVVERIVQREDDGILTGTGDGIYINQNLEDMMYFLSWYLYHQIGNCITFRPVYKWSGTRALDMEAWKRIVKLCSEMGLHYCHMLDGRELPGCNSNPDISVMSSSYFTGFQSHEQDGAYYYQGASPVEPINELYYDLWSRTADKGGICPSNCPVRTENGTFAFFDPCEATDMKEAALKFIQNVRSVSKHASRHTGPSALFRYFYQAGFEYLGAELMYGPQEVILSALRGASLAYGKKDYGAHLAVQWSTTPHDSEQRYRRYFLALYTCYMHGVQHINTEEGLWRLEEGNVDFDRFSTPCIEHRKIQTDFLHFVKNHSRRGEMHIPFAFLHGQYDGWVCFTRGQVWARKGDEWKFGRPEESWDLINIFYPLSVLDAIYRHPCPNNPQGFYSGTPYGPVDILPVEASIDIMGKYKTLAFLGWNTADAEQISKLVAFVENGGTLLLGWPHLFTSTKRAGINDDFPEVLDNCNTWQLTGFDFGGFIKTEDNNGNAIIAGVVDLRGAVPLEVNETGIPIVLENSLGSGKVLFVNVKAYPAESCVRNIYDRLLIQMGEDIICQEKEKGWIKSTNDVEFTVYDIKEKDLRIVYLLNIGWWYKENHYSYVSLLWGERSIRLKIYRDCMNMITMSKNWAVWVYDSETDIMDINEKQESLEIILQGYGVTEFLLIHKYNNRVICKFIASVAGAGIKQDERWEGAYKVLLDVKGLATLNIRICNYIKLM